MAVVGFLLILGTAVDILIRKKILQKTNILVEIIKCFSVYTNGGKLLNTRQADGSGHLGCLNGIRTISMLWIILGHVYLIGSGVFMKNPLDVEKVSKIIISKST